MNRPIYRRRDQWILCVCDLCGKLNYVEPHGTTAVCPKCNIWTQHSNIPQKFRDPSGARVIATPTKRYNIFWAPEGRVIATVDASTAKAAKKKTPSPYKKYLGEVYIELVEEN